MKTEDVATPLAPAHVISPPSSTHSRNLTPSSHLSSPFMAGLSLNEPNSSSNPSAFEKALIEGSNKSSPMVVDSPFIPGSLPRTPPPLPAPVPQRAIGGEIHRIRLQLAADQAAHYNETEARRPDYLVREKRPPPDPDAEFIPESFDIEDQQQQQQPPGLGVTESPSKGRRIKLFQETSEESFEQSLLAGGYPGYGSLPSYNEQNVLGVGEGHKGNGLSQRAMQWLQQATPGRPGPSTAALEPEQDWIPSEKEIRKRKRLAAFQVEYVAAGRHPRVRPVEVEGKGRLLLNVPEDQVPSAVHESPSKKRSNRRRKKSTTAVPLSPQRKKGQGLDAAALDDEEIPRPNWLDSSFPWSMRAQERAEQARLEQAEKLKAIERFLDRDSDSDGENGDQSLRPPVSAEEEELSLRRGRGKMVPLKVQSNGRAANGFREVDIIPSDPADARAALLSKKSVRELAQRRQQRQRWSADDDSDTEVLCHCHGTVDDPDVVQCDDCHVWYHLSCIGIKDIAELGEEEDPWYCSNCLGLGPLPSSDPASEPTFVPTDERPQRSAFRDPLFFQSSPVSAWPSSSSVSASARAPKTPVRLGSGGRDKDRDRDFAHVYSSRSSWEDSSELGTPLNSSHSVRIYNTPLLHHSVGSNSGDAVAAYDPFDPSTTPSRGIKFHPGAGGTSSGPSAHSHLSTTPRTTASQWTHRSTNAAFHTPVQRYRDVFKGGAGAGGGGGVGGGGGTGGTFPFSFGNSGGLPFSMTSPARNIYSFDDTPVRRHGVRTFDELPVQLESPTRRH